MAFGFGLACGYDDWIGCFCDATLLAQILIWWWFDSIAMVVVGGHFDDGQRICCLALIVSAVVAFVALKVGCPPKQVSPAFKMVHAVVGAVPLPYLVYGAAVLSAYFCAVGVFKYWLSRHSNSDFCGVDQQR